METPWMRVAEALLGTREERGAVENPKIIEMLRLAGHGWVKDDETPWSAAFVGACLTLSGYANSGRTFALSFLDFGLPLDKPRRGCIAVFSRGGRDSGFGHAGFYEREQGDTIFVHGGNQTGEDEEEVSVKGYHRDRLLSFRWPEETAPLPDDTDLPTILDLAPDEAPIHLLAPDLADTGGEAAETDMEDAMEINGAMALDAVTEGGADGADDPAAFAALAMAAALPPARLAKLHNEFSRLNAFVAKWEGGFVNNPRDPGGATKYGITRATLARWRGKAVSVADVRNLTRKEADAIFRANYYDVVQGDYLPVQAAAVTYNGAVLHGPNRSVRFLQQAMNTLGIRVDGRSISVDGGMGAQTLAGARKANSLALANAYLNNQERFLRGLSTFKTFGKGWINRVNATRTFVRSLATVAPPAPNPEPAPAPALAAQVAALDIRLDALEAALERIEAALEGGGAEASAGIESAAALRMANAATGTPAGSGERIASVIEALQRAGLVKTGSGLTPVNAALGETVGGALDGKKTVLGTVGLLATTLLPQLGALFPSLAPLAGAIQDAAPTLLPLAAALTGWGVLGKIDKWMNEQSIRRELDV